LWRKYQKNPDKMMRTERECSRKVASTKVNIVTKRPNWQKEKKKGKEREEKTLGNQNLERP